MTTRAAESPGETQARRLEQVYEEVARLLRDAELRVRLAAASAAICDGLGAARVAEAFLKLIAARR